MSAVPSETFAALDLPFITHAFIGSVIYQVPGQKWSSALARHLIGGWQISGIFRTTTGVPLVVTQTSTKAGSRPDVVDFPNAYKTGCCDLSNMQYLNPAAFAAVPISSISRETIRAGNVGNGAFRGPKYRNLDVSFGKSFTVSGSKTIELRADVLNFFNWINFTTIQTNITAANFGQAVGTDAARVAQLQIRFAF